MLCEVYNKNLPESETRILVFVFIISLYSSPIKGRKHFKTTGKSLFLKLKQSQGLHLCFCVYYGKVMY